MTTLPPRSTVFQRRCRAWLGHVFEHWNAINEEMDDLLHREEEGLWHPGYTGGRGLIRWAVGPTEARVEIWERGLYYPDTQHKDDDVLVAVIEAAESGRSITYTRHAEPPTENARRYAGKAAAKAMAAMGHLGVDLPLQPEPA
jgi:hypothetical protein